MSSLDSHHNSTDHTEVTIVTSEANSTTMQANSVKPEQASRQTNLQRIQQRKQAVLSFPYTRKLLKLAIYSKCQVTEYKIYF